MRRTSKLVWAWLIVLLVVLMLVGVALKGGRTEVPAEIPVPPVPARTEADPTPLALRSGSRVPAETDPIPSGNSAPTPEGLTSELNVTQETPKTPEYACMAADRQHGVLLRLIDVADVDEPNPHVVDRLVDLALAHAKTTHVSQGQRWAEGCSAREDVLPEVVELLQDLDLNDLDRLERCLDEGSCPDD